MLTLLDDKVRVTTGAQIGGASLTFVHGDVLELATEAIVCYSSTSLTMQSNLAQRLIERGGALIRAEGAKHAPARLGDALVLPTGKLSSRYIIVAVTNQLRNAPTLASLHACMGVISERAAGLGLRSLAIPLLRVGRSLGPEDILRATLAPLIDHCAGPTSLGHVFIVLDAEGGLGAPPLLSRHTQRIVADLLELGRLRTRARALYAAEAQLRSAACPATPMISEVLQAQLLIQQQVLHQLERSLTPGGAGFQAIVLELDHCRSEIDRIWATLAERDAIPPLERAVGG
jgi:Macro domain